MFQLIRDSPQKQRRMLPSCATTCGLPAWSRLQTCRTLKRQTLIRRLERLKRVVTADWQDCPALSLMLTLWCFLEDLTDREVLILWEGSAMDRAASKLMPMCGHGIVKSEHGDAVQEQAGALLRRLQAEGLYR